MQLATFSYSSHGGWSLPSFPDLDSPRTLVTVFGASDFGSHPAPLEELRAAYPSACFVGCSTSGEIAGAEVRDGTISVAVARFERSDLRAVAAEIGAQGDSFAAGRHLAQALAGDGLRAVFVLSDGLNVNGSELVHGINSVLPSDVVVTGGLAGDGSRFERTWVLGQDGPRSGLISAVGIYGQHVRVGHGSRGGWSIFGPERRVTRSEGNQLYELDGKPALELYKTYLGEHAAGLPASALLFPLAVRADCDDPRVLVRTILSVDEDRQSLTFAGNVPEGHMAQLMQTSLERLIDGASQAAVQVMEELDAAAGESLSIAISCVGRRLLLGERTEEEVEAVLAELPQRTAQVGFYSYGEISPHDVGRCDLHNQTMTLTVISES